MKRIAIIETEKAGRLMKALCNHFARKITASYEGDKGYIKFQDGTCELTATAISLTLQVEADDIESHTRVKEVVVNHLLRIAPDENFQIIWN